MEARSIYPHATEEFPLLQVNNRYCSGTLALQGAQILSFKPRDRADLLWVSPRAVFENGQTLRGGIPVCLPWFGVNRRDPDKPRHGLARTIRWALEQAITNDSGETRLKLALRQFAQTPHPLFEHCFEATLTITFSAALVIQLQVKNCSELPMPLSWALHSYHPVSRLDKVFVTGLDQVEYLDNTRELERFTQSGDPRFDGEFDRVYLGVGKQQVIRGEPEIHISADNAPSAIVWNPGARLAANMADLGEENYQAFICLERGAAFDDEQIIESGGVMRATVTIAPAAGQSSR